MSEVLLIDVSLDIV